MPTQVLVTGITGFIGSHVAIQLLQRGYDVRGTLRSMARAAEIRAGIAGNLVADPGERLTFAAAELMADGGWADAMAGCSAVLHIASPVPTKPVRDPQEVIRPAREGTVRVLKAAAAAGVKRVVLTSSTAAISYGHGVRSGRTYSEADWSDVDGPDIGTYETSKTLAEQAAWAFQKAEAPELELVAINPGAVLGPVLERDYGASAEIVRKLMSGEFPGCPALGWPIVDVRDVAGLHIAALEHPAAAGERFICAGEFLWMKEIAQILKRELPAESRKVPSRSLPDVVVRLVALFDRTARVVLHELGSRKEVTADKARQMLGWTPRPAAEAVVATAQSLVRHGIV